MKRIVKRYKLSKRGKKILGNIFVLIFYTLLFTRINYKSIYDCVVMLILWLSAYMSMLLLQDID